jgi:hypothetical protein
MKEVFFMSNYPDTITFEGKERVIVTWDLKGFFKWVVVDDAILVDNVHLGELFSLSSI